MSVTQNMFVGTYPFNSVPTPYVDSGALIWDHSRGAASSPSAPPPGFLASSPMMYVNGPSTPSPFSSPSPLPSSNGSMFVLVNQPQPQHPSQPGGQQVMMLIPTIASNIAREAPAKVPEGQSICRHFMVGRCNRRKCRFVHPSVEPYPVSVPAMPEGGLAVSQHNPPTKESFESMSINRSSLNDISTTTSPFTSKSEMFFSSSVADSVLMDAFCRKV